MMLPEMIRDSAHYYYDDAIMQDLRDAVAGK